MTHLNAGVDPGHTEILASHVEVVFLLPRPEYVLAQVGAVLVSCLSPDVNHRKRKNWLRGDSTLLSGTVDVWPVWGLKRSDVEMDVRKYLSRIGYAGPVAPSLQVLRSIQTCHLRSVPFESLAIHCSERIQLDLPLLYDKIVNRNRGGFCYENNGLFSWLLNKLSFKVTLLSGHVRNEELDLYGPPFDHLILMVILDGQRWLCDVGFGARCSLAPLSLETSDPQVQGHRAYRIRGDAEMILEYKQESGGVDGAWTQLHKFTLEPCRLEDFTEMCQYHQSSPCSLFYSKSFCTLFQPGGILTYIGHRLVSTTFPTAPGDLLEITTRDLKDEEIPGILAEKFGIVLTSPLIPKDEKIKPRPVMH